ncbi:MAG TPA: Ig-like domain-containing protein [Longimicrobium sp.]|nr:Ig-like domain-containing protein [Longimicrobium sp.]
MLPRMITLAAAAILAAAACRDAAGPGGVAVYMRFSGPEPRVQAGSTLQLTATALDARERPVADVEIGYRSEQPGIATVDATGRVTGVSPGNTRITAWAGKAYGYLALVVEPRGGLQLARFALLPPDSIHRQIGIDTWALAPQVLSFVARNAAGVSLCGQLPLQIAVRDPGMLTAAYQPGGDGCTIRLNALDGPQETVSTVLRATLGGVSDSVEVTVHRTRTRVVFSWPLAYTRGVPAGADVRYEVVVLGADGNPVPGVPVRFVLDTVFVAPFNFEADGVVNDTTDASGMAATVVKASTSTIVERTNEYYGTFWIRHRPLMNVTAAVAVEGGTWLASPPLDVIAAEPERILVYVQRYGWRFDDWLEIPGDSVGTGPVYCSALATTRTALVGAAVVDRYGNATPHVATVSAPGVKIATSQRSFTLRESWMGGPTQRRDYLDGMLLTVQRERPGETATFTFSYPGVPSRTVRVVSNARCYE